MHPTNRGDRVRLAESFASALIAAILATPSLASAQAPEPQDGTEERPPLAEYFGFDGLDILPLGGKSGPAVIADFDGDNLLDLVVVNNRSSRVELFRQKPGASPDDPVPPPSRVNEFPDHWRFERSWIPVGHEIGSIVAGDFDRDGTLELAYAGQPGSIVFLEQTEPGRFEVARREPVKGLSTSSEGFAIADLVGDEGLEAIGIVGGRLQVWPILDGYRLGQPTVLSAGTGNLTGFSIEDVDGDGHRDLVGIIPEDGAPLRVWLATVDPRESSRSFGPQLRFEMPGLRQLGTVRLPDDPAARLAVIERASKRLALYELAPDAPEAGTGRPSLRYFGFDDPTARKRFIAVADVDGDGLRDLVASNVEANSIVVYRQVPGRGFEQAASFPAYAELEGLAARDLDGDGRAEILLQSEKEGVAGVARWRDGSVSFPQALPLSAGHVPVTIAAIELDGGPAAAVVARENRSYVLDLVPIGGEATSVPLGDLPRAPGAILALDANGSGRTDLLLLTPDRPMLMLEAQPSDSEAAWKLLTSTDMGQFGLAQAASADNTAVYDLDGDGREELLVADRNFIRALRYDPSPAAGTTPGWQIVGQLNADRADSKLVSLAVFPDRVVAADRANNRLVVFVRTASGWRQEPSIELEGFRVRSIEAGAFSGDDGEDILVAADDGFAIVRLSGGSPVLREVGSWRPEDERSLHHDVVSGDVNGDGFTDLAIADAGRQSLDLLTFAEDGSLAYATGFPVFQTRIFSAGEVREFEPHQMLVGDVTGDGLADLVLLCHDRVLVYPQDSGEGDTASAAP
ncbi:MAG: FG-GAP repeat domain-containing protein [Phycisphaerales bacterium]